MEGESEKTPGLETVNTCTGKMEIPTPRERQALAAMKSNKERVREIKKRLEELKKSKTDAHMEEIAPLENEMARLKAAWDALEIERDAAAKERMILLGHE